MKHEQDIERLRQAVTQLAEHYDSVHVFVTRCETGEVGGTINIDMGCGNFYATYGSVAEWMDKMRRLSELQAEVEEEDADDPG